MTSRFFNCCEGQVYLFYPFRWLLRLGKYLKTSWIKVFFSIKVGILSEKSPCGLKLFFNKNRIDYCVTYLATFAYNCTGYNYHTSTCKFQKIRFCTRWKFIKFTLSTCLDTRQSEILTNFLEIARLIPLRT